MPGQSKGTERVNVLYLVRTWAFGGSHTIILHLLEHLPRDRFDIVCVPYETPAGTDRAFVAEAEKRGLEVAEDRVPWRSRRDWWRARRAVSGLLEKYQTQLLHTHDPHSNMLVGIGRGRWPCACVASAYGWWSNFWPLRRCINIWIERTFALKNFERVITVSNHMKSKILRGPAPEDRIRVVHTGLDTGRFRGIQPSDGAAVRAECSIPDDACVAGTLSRVSAEKGHAHLLQAAAMLKDRFPRLHLLIVGDGPARPELEGLAAALGMGDRVHFTGFHDRPLAALAAMDIFVQPSVLEEGFPTSVLEAELTGLPVVASEIGGTSETMDVPHTGLLVPPGDESALADALASLVSSPERREVMGRAARTHVQTAFTLENMVNQVATVYDEAVAAFGQRNTGP